MPRGQSQLVWSTDPIELWGPTLGTTGQGTGRLDGDSSRHHRSADVWRCGRPLSVRSTT